MTEKHEFKFRGVNVRPEVLELLCEGKITTTEFALLVLIDALVDCRGDGCWASNAYLAERVRKTPDHVKEMVKKLCRMGAVHRVGWKEMGGKKFRVLETAWSRVTLKVDGEGDDICTSAQGGIETTRTSVQMGTDTTPVNRRQVVSIPPRVIGIVHTPSSAPTSLKKEYVKGVEGGSGGASAPDGALLLPSPTPPEESRKTSKATTSPSPIGKGRPKDKEGKDTTSKYIVREPTKEERGRTYYASFDLVSMSECPPDPPAGMVVRNWTDDCSGETRNYLENMRSIPLNWVFPNPDYVPPPTTTPPSPTPSAPAPAVDGYRPMTGKIRRPAGVDPSIEDIHIHLQAELRRIVRGRKVAWGATSGSANTWAQDMKRLVKAVGVPRIEAVLDYLAKNINEIERPAILSASQFVSRFDWLENLRKKHQERPY